MLNTKVHVGFLAPGLSEAANSITKTLIMHPETRFSDLYDEMAGAIKIMDGRPSMDGCSTLVFSLRDNGSALTK